MFSIYAENDFAMQKDYYYTHATRLSYQQDNGWEYVAAQNIYTPKNKDTVVPDAGDRPYAGWLYGGVGKTIQNGLVEHYFEVDLGIVGPDSYAYESQKTIHEWIGCKVPKGWDSQIPDEFAYEFLNKESLSLLDNPYFNIVPYTELAGGNVQSYVGVGGVIMFGYNVEQSMHNNQIPIKAINISKDKRFYGFIGGDERYVFNDIFLDDNDYNGYPYSVKREHGVGDVQFGLCAQYKFVKITWSRDYRSKEFKTEGEGFKGYDSIKLSFCF